VRDGGIFADSRSRVSAGTTFVLDPGGAIEEKPRNNQGYVDDPGKQRLVLDGPFVWNGGTIDADVWLTETSVLTMSGPAQHGHAAGLLLLKGSGVIAASTVIDVAAGRLRVEGDLLLQSPLAIHEGKGWTLDVDVHGSLRIAGTQTVVLGNNPLVNQGSIEVTEGILRLQVQTDRLSQGHHGVLTVAAGAELHGDSLMRLGGTITGDGVIVGDLDAQGTVRPGTEPAPGRLGVRGRCHLGSRSRTVIRIDGDAPGQGYSQLLATDTVEVDGTLVVEAGPGFAVGEGKVLDIVRTDAAAGLAGRFRRATLPRPVAGPYLRVNYTPEAVQLVATTNVVGLDAQYYPGDDVMREVIQDKHYRWVGYYLQTYPEHPDPSWLFKRDFLIGLGLGIAVLYVGLQHPANGLHAANGRRDALDATEKTSTEGFPRGSWVYLDVEWESGGISPSHLEYAIAWAREMLRLDYYLPAIYCPSQDVAALFPGLMAAFREAQRDDRPRFWVAALGRPFDPTQPVTDGGTPEAVAWQRVIDTKKKPHWELKPNGEPYRLPHPVEGQGDEWHTDINLAVLPDPSAP
jgi:hypothetical protein